MPPRATQSKLPFARKLRREMTVAEANLWHAVRDGRLDGLKFRRQVPLGRYVVDFLCVESRLIVELDGPPHDDPRQKAHDAARDRWLRERGYRILRASNDLALGGLDLLLGKIKSLARALQS